MALWRRMSAFDPKRTLRKYTRVAQDRAMLKLFRRPTVDLVLVPRQSIGPFRLGSSRQEIRAAAEQWGWPLFEERGSLDYFASNSIQVEYEDGAADFIGVANEPALFKLTFRGHNLFDMPADHAFRLLREGEGDNAEAEYDASGLTFHKQIVTLWEADEGYDWVRRKSGAPTRPVWGQIGIGTPEYLLAVSGAG